VIAVAKVAYSHIDFADAGASLFVEDYQIVMATNSLGVIPRDVSF
jgi:hypothetical protein